MERIRRCAAGLVFWGSVGVLFGGGRALAQTGAGSGRAVVYPVPTTGEAGRFRVPQVRLADAAVARRINGFLLRQFRDGVYDAVDSTASPQRQVRQAARLCCYDEETKTWWVGGQGVTETGYTVLLNQNYVLSLGFSSSYNGLEQPGGTHFTFDLRTGRVLALADLVADPPAQLGRRLQAAISRRLRDNIAQAVTDGNDSASIARMAWLYQIETWDTTPQRAYALDMAGSDENDPNNAAFLRLTDFALEPDALLLYHPIGMSRADFEFLPDDTYTFPYGRIRPKGLLLPVAQAAGKRKPRR